MDRADQVDGMDGVRTASAEADISAVTLEIPFKLPDRSVKEIKSLEGTLMAMVPGRVETFVVGLDQQRHVVKRGESVWILSLREYDVPVWLFRQYNPSLDPHKVTPGTTIRFPTLASTEGS